MGWQRSRHDLAVPNENDGCQNHFSPLTETMTDTSSNRWSPQEPLGQQKMFYVEPERAHTGPVHFFLAREQGTFDGSVS